MYRGSSLISVFAAAAVAAVVFAAPGFAQDSGWGGDAEDFSAPPAPAQMTGGDDADFSAALEAAAAAEGKGGKEFVPKNEIIITKRPVDADSSAKKAKKKTGGGEKLKHTMGGRLGIGSEMELGLGLAIGLSDVNRLDLGINMGLGLVHGSDINGFGLFEAYAIYEWRFNISEELSWFAGAGGAIGYHSASWDIEKVAIVNGDTTTIKERVSSKTPFGISAGGRVGLEVDLSFIDPEHALSSLRNSSVSLDVRPMLCIFAKKYPGFVMTVGINYNYVFGGGKGKEKK
jgi:hypothetical protein